VSLDGRAVGGYADLREALAQIAPGTEVEVAVERDGRAETVRVTTSKGEGDGSLLGITAAVGSSVEVKFGIEDIGGPSAGSMFALGIIDKLGPDDLAAGRVIAGTGTVDPVGGIGAIGGIEQKMIAAKRDGAEVFLAPAANCGEVKGHEPPGLNVVKVATLSDAVSALAALRSGDEDALPRCS
jgi:PDZ domain-containing protein